MPLGLVAAIAAWLFLARQEPRVLVAHKGVTELSPPLSLPPFSLETVGDGPVTVDSLKGRWTLLSIGFASCPDICPNTLSVLSQAVSQAEAPNDNIQVLFVSVDPERDSPELLHAYVKHFGDSVLGATGSHEQLRALTEPLGLFYQRESGGARENSYSVQHSTTVLLVGPSGEVVALLRGGELTADEIADALNAFMRRT